MRKFLLFLCSFLPWLVSAQVATQVEINGLYYNIYDQWGEEAKTVAELLPNPNGGYVGDVTVPKTVSYDSKDYEVIILSSPFYNNPELISVKFPEDMAKADISFGECSQLQSVILPKNLTEIGYGAFENCFSLASIEIPSTVSDMGQRCFSYCRSIKSIVIPEGIKVLRSESFRNCEMLTEVKLPPSLVEIEDRVFEDCHNLPKIELPSGLKSIGELAFDYCSSITNITLPSSLTYMGPYSLRAMENLLSLDIVSASEPLKIGYLCLDGTRNLNRINIGRDLDTSDSTYETISNLSTINIGEKVTNLSWLNPLDINELLQVVCEANTPPTVGRFSDAQYANTYVFVPESAKSAYESDQNWAFFNNLAGLERPANEYNIQISPESAVINVGEPLNFDYTVEPFIGCYVNMMTSDPTIAPIPEFGLIYGAAPGEADITMTLLLNGKTSTCHVTVIQPATDIRLNKTKLNLELGETTQLLANVSPADVTDNSVTWSTSNEAVATVDANGVVTAVGGGNCTVTATTHNGLTATCNVTVKQLPESISFTESAIAIGIGESHSLEVVFNPENTTERGLTWSSSNTTIATVNNAGEVTGKGAGKAVITAKTTNGLTATCNVTVEVPVTNVEFEQDYYEMFTGETLTIVATVTPDNAADKTLTWTSDNERIAKVDQNGVVTALRKGEALITATSVNGVEAYCLVTVKQAPTSISLNESDIDLPLGDEFQLVATVKPADSEDKSVVWVSSDPGTATVDANGLVKAIENGTAIITATTVNGLKAECEVNVVTVKVESIELNPSSIESLEGTEVQIEATVYPSNATNKALSWSTSSVIVASVDENGLVSVKSSGIAVITATAKDGSGVKAECQVTGISGIEEIFADGRTWDLYDLNGIKLGKGIGESDFQKLKKGIYILRNANSRIKVVIGQ